MNDKQKKINRDEIEERVKKIVIDHCNVEAEKVTMEASFADDLGTDSLDQVELVMAFEEEFNCSISDDIAEKIKKVSDAVSFIYDAQFKNEEITDK
ncbi:Acyl carrier protein AcpP [Rickettsiales bacterium Ac37b]|nr:Acyl carrier protein AcpP [Rickettsiales bacterium Ac37b]